MNAVRRRWLGLRLLSIVALIGALSPALTTTRAAADGSPTIVLSEHGPQPAQMQVASGQAVTWINRMGDPVTLVSESGAWPAKWIGEDQQWSYAFRGAGTYTYHWSHEDETWSGSVTVSAVNAPPVATSTSTAQPPAGATATPAPAPPSGVTVSIRNYAYSPDPLRVPLGTTVTWVNNDPDSHTATSDAGVSPAFNSGSLRQGQTSAHTFGQAGTYAYHCEFHSNMHGTIVVSAGAPPGATPTPTSTLPAAPTATATSVATSTPAPSTGSAGANAISIANYAFQPSTLSVPVGATVTWTNQDPDAHTATSDTGVFDSGRLAQGQTFSHTFNDIGSFTYKCAFHSNMHGTIVVGGAPTPTATPSLTLTVTPTVTPAASGGANSVAIANYAFHPATLSVPVGATVTWTNQDADAHTATSDTGVFDSGRLGQGQSYSHTFNDIGSFTYKCAFHSNMHGTIVVGGAPTPTPTPSPTLLPTATTVPDAAAGAAGAATSSSGSVTIVNYGYQPSTLTVGVGGIVTWTNQDPDPHTVTSDAPGIFDSGMLAQNQTFSYTFNQPGTFAYHCAYHANMHGTIVVQAAAASAASAPAAAQAAQIAPVGQQVAGVTVAGPVPALIHDTRYFAATGFRIDDDAMLEYFQHRGGLDAFGYPISREFTFMGCRMQLFQRKAAQVCIGQEPEFMNLLDPDFPPLINVNGSTFPAPDPDLKNSTPSVTDPNYATRIIDFVRTNAPDTFEGEPVNFGQTFFSAITADMLPDDALGTIDLVNLEVWGAPISRPMRDPHNANFIYQRFQRGIMHYDAATGTTRGILLGDYLKQIMQASPDLAPDVRQDSQPTRFFNQYCPTSAGWICRPDDLPATDLTYAFAGDLSAPVNVAGASVAAPTDGTSINIVDFGYDPATLTVPAGSRVRWTNRGRVPHTVADSSGGWHSDLLRTGQSYEQQFDTPGTYGYYCTVHPAMSATIVVTAAPEGGPAPAADAAPPAAAPAPAPAPAAVAAPASAAVTVANSAFQPASLTVAVGTTVTWTNQDAVPHTATATGSPAFDSGLLMQNQSWSHTFDTAGTFNYVCAVHPNMHGTIEVQGG